MWTTKPLAPERQLLRSLSRRLTGALPSRRRRSGPVNSAERTIARGRVRTVSMRAISCCAEKGFDRDLRNAGIPRGDDRAALAHLGHMDDRNGAEFVFVGGTNGAHDGEPVERRFEIVHDRQIDLATHQCRQRFFAGADAADVADAEARQNAAQQVGHVLSVFDDQYAQLRVSFGTEGLDFRCRVVLRHIRLSFATRRCPALILTMAETLYRFVSEVRLKRPFQGEFRPDSRGDCSRASCAPSMRLSPWSVFSQWKGRVASCQIAL